MPEIYARLKRPLGPNNVHGTGDLLLLIHLPANDHPYTLNTREFDSDRKRTHDTSYRFTEAEFSEYFDALVDQVDAEEIYDREIGDSKRRLRSLESDLAKRASAPLVGDGEVSLDQLDWPEEESDSTAPDAGIQVHGKTHAGGARNALFRKRHEAMALGQEIAKASASIQARLEAKIATIKGDLAHLHTFVQRIGKAVHSINLYLGKDERIIPISTGKKADPSEPLHIRQLILRIDEELAVSNPEGSDWRNFTDFESWLLVPSNLRQVCPEEKGIVVLTARGSAKHYHDNPLVNALENEPNFRSYWLLRNGENLFGIHADVELSGRVLFDAPEEMNECFFATDPGSGERVPMRPGSAAYRTAMERAVDANLRAMQTILFLQGILDRTLIFHPYPDEQKPNLLDSRTFGSSVRLIYDYSRGLTTGRPTFSEWQMAANQRLQHGDRIVGRFHGFVSDDHQGAKFRVYPRSAQGFDEDGIHVVEERGRAMVFKFDRTDRLRSSDFKPRRGTYTVYRADRFFINVDSITEQEILYYIHDRCSRSSYVTMMGTLQRALRLLQKERREEDPFRELLRQKMEEKRLGLPVTDDLLEVLVRWYKEKTKEKRTLLAEEGKAYRLILGEYEKLARECSAKPTQPELEDFLSRERNGLTVFVGMNHRNQIVLVQRDHASSKYVHEVWWRFTAECGFAQERTVAWIGANPALNRLPTIFFEHPDWRSLTADHPNSADIRACDVERAVDLARNSRSENRRVVAVVRRSDTIVVYVRPVQPGEFDAGKLGLSFLRYESGELHLNIDRANKREDFVSGRSDELTLCLRWPTSYVHHSPEIKHSDADYRIVPQGVLLWESHEEILELEKWVHVERRLRAKRRNLASQIEAIVAATNAASKAHHRQLEVDRWTAAGGDPGFIEDHLKTVSPAPEYAIPHEFWHSYKGFNCLFEHPLTPVHLGSPATIREATHVFMGFPDDLGRKIAESMRVTFSAILDVRIITESSSGD